MEFKQQKFFTKRFFELRKNGLFFRTSNLSSSYESELPYEEVIFNKLARERKADTWLLKAAFITAIFAVIAIIKLAYDGLPATSADAIGNLFIIALPLLSLGAFFTHSKNRIIIPLVNGSFLELWGENPNKEAVDAFLNDLKNAAHKRLKERFGTIDKTLPLEMQLNGLVWLRDREVLTEEEFDTLKKQLTGQSDNRTPVGF